MNLEQELNQWMDNHQNEYFDLIRTTMDEFEAAHPGSDDMMIKINALSMADRRFMSKAISEVLGKYLQNNQGAS
jgi:hypothetical protein